MKTITPAIKCAIAALYYGQKIMQTTIKHDPNNLSGLMWVEPIAFKEEDSQYFLNVTPLQNITDEECAVIWMGKTVKQMIYYLTGGNYGWTSGIEQYLYNHLNPSDYDYLRSRGYALPYMDWSVGELIENGVFKLKEKKE